MAQNEQEKFSELFSNTLTDAAIERAYGADGEAYVVYNEHGILFNIAYRKMSNKYIFGRTELFKSEYAKYGLSIDSVPDHKMVFETVAFSYKTRTLVQQARKDFSVIYKDLLIDSDIIFQMRGEFETYFVLNAGIPCFAIGHSQKTGKHGFKRYELINILYKLCNIPMEKKPDYASLYQRTKDHYMAQTVVESMRDFEIY